MPTADQIANVQQFCAELDDFAKHMIACQTATTTDEYKKESTLAVEFRQTVIDKYIKQIER
jgi:predicted nucleic acid-binding Zn finger protein